MKYFVIIRVEDITNKMLGCTGFDNPVPSPVGDSTTPAHDYRIISITSENEDCFKGYKKYSLSEVSIATEALLSGRKVHNKLRSETKMSAWSDPEGARARYQSLGILSNDEPEIVWDVYVDYLINGVIYYVTGAEIGDTLDFEVWHPVDGKLDGFASGWLLWDGSHDSSGYPAKICAGLQIKVRLNKGEGNVGETKVLLNAKLHELP